MNKSVYTCGCAIKIGILIISLHLHTKRRTILYNTYLVESHQPKYIHPSVSKCNQNQLSRNFHFPHIKLNRIWNHNCTFNLRTFKNITHHSSCNWIQELYIFIWYTTTYFICYIKSYIICYILIIILFFYIHIQYT